jgi:large subunit ribosomal protein L20
MRVKTGVSRHAKHKKMLKAAKGYLGRRRSVFKLAKQAVIKAGRYSYRDRRVKKREMRALWIIKMNAALRALGISYSQFIDKANKNNMTINRKILSDIAMNNPATFAEIVNKVK